MRLRLNMNFKTSMYAPKAVLYWNTLPNNQGCAIANGNHGCIHRSLCTRMLHIALRPIDVQGSRIKRKKDFCFICLSMFTKSQCTADSVPLAFSAGLLNTKPQLVRKSATTQAVLLGQSDAPKNVRINKCQMSSACGVLWALFPASSMSWGFRRPADLLKFCLGLGCEASHCRARVPAVILQLQMLLLKLW